MDDPAYHDCKAGPCPEGKFRPRPCRRNVSGRMVHYLDPRTKLALCRTRSTRSTKWGSTWELAFVTCRECRDRIEALGAKSSEEIARALTERLRDDTTQ